LIPGGTCPVSVRKELVNDRHPVVIEGWAIVEARKQKEI
jgi:hypothetical protein